MDFWSNVQPVAPISPLNRGFTVLRISKNMWYIVILFWQIFLGGVPWDITESMLITAFRKFGVIRVEWPGKDQAASQPKGYVYIIFESEKQVR
jgi:hypothetical protein